MTENPTGLGFREKNGGCQPRIGIGFFFYFTVQAPGIFYLQRDGILYAWRAKIDEKKNYLRLSITLH